MTNKPTNLLPYLALSTVLVVFVIGMYVGSWIPLIPARPVPIARPIDVPVITPEPITITDTPVAEPTDTGVYPGTPVACTLEVMECPDGSTTVRNPYRDCQFYACTADDGQGGDIFDQARVVYGQMKKQTGLESVAIQHVEDPNNGHVYQAVFYTTDATGVAQLARQFERIMKTHDYEAAPNNPQDVSGIMTSHFSKQTPIYHGFEMEQHPDHLLINFWWD